jgi:Ser/Thr protein kinase RdoA (MazF antagonist)
MRWLSAIRRDTGLPVPEPVFNRDGKLLTRVSLTGTPDVRNCTLLKWVKGHFVNKRLSPWHFRAQGRLMAQLHDHTERWKVPRGLWKRRFDWKGLFRDNSGAKIPASEVWPLLKERFRDPYEEVARKTKTLMRKLGEGRDVFGLIHADCGTDANVLFWKGEARPIDFDGSGFGYYAYDLAVALEHVWQKKEYEGYRDALFDGYLACRSMPDEQLSSAEFFLASFYVYMGLWQTAILHTTRTPRRNHLIEGREWGLKYIKRCISRRA